MATEVLKETERKRLEIKTYSNPSIQNEDLTPLLNSFSKKTLELQLVNDITPV